MLYDEGGLSAMSAVDLAVVRAALAATLESADSERIIVRAATHPKTAVTIVGRAEDDEDDVDLWHEIPRP